MRLLSSNLVLELKNCSKRDPGFERCQCLQEMDGSNVEKVKVKSAKALIEDAQKMNLPIYLICILVWGGYRVSIWEYNPKKAKAAL